LETLSMRPRHTHWIGNTLHETKAHTLDWKHSSWDQGTIHPEN